MNWSYRLKLSALMLTAIATSSASGLELVVGAGGDLSFSDNHLRRPAPPEPHPTKLWDWNGDHNGEREATYTSLTSRVKDLFWGSDINFLNIETAISDSKSGLKSPKNSGFAFVSHSGGIRHLIEELNVNLMSLSNNHINDFGQEGMARTRQAMEALKRQYPFIAYHGIRRKDEKVAPVEFTAADGVRVAFAAINMSNSGGGAYSLMSVHNDSEYRTLIQAFKNSSAELKILSVHYGTEGQVKLNSGQRDRYRYAVDHGGVNLVLGHHPHVIRPIEIYKGAAIYYSLGNFLITGAANLDHRPDNYRNYSIFTKTFFHVTKGRSAEITALQAIPLKGMHWRPYVPSAKVGTTNLTHLNKLNRTEMGSTTGVEFQITSEGKGVHCIGPQYGARAQRICR